ncbi:hypothetical protein AAFF_G00390000 [Aldrovandia affinis]|uniref:Uncharacterized protein n=1 Tax=Aldrovandia affinis TaxID=143900 RepID=A0AAD7SES0_9TELE|nr:hypothetical protein AAFF_G00390000 [Aldrovandia affinis]
MRKGFGIIHVHQVVRSHIPEDRQGDKGAAGVEERRKASCASPAGTGDGDRGTPRVSEWGGRPTPLRWAATLTWVTPPEQRLHKRVTSRSRPEMT